MVLVSGAGTNLQALLDACADPAYGAQVVAVGADRDGIEGLARAERAGIPTFVQRVKDFTPPAPTGTRRHRRLRGAPPDLVVSAGFMKLAGHDVPRRVRRPLRQHPPGAAARRSRDARRRDALEYGVKVTGATLFVVDAGVDTGPIVAQTAVPVEDDDDVETAARADQGRRAGDAGGDRGPDGARGLHDHRSPGAVRAGTRRSRPAMSPAPRGGPPPHD